MRRREFIGLLGTAALSAARPGYAQTGNGLPLVGVLSPGSEEFAKNKLAPALRVGLQEAGFIEGTNYSLAMRIANGDWDRLPSLAKELGALKPRVIVASGTALVVREALPEIPMVFTGLVSDPVTLGFAESYARPGGMTTGIVMNAIGGEEAITEKRMGLFKELVPALTRLGMISTINDPTSVAEQNALRKVAGHLGFEFMHYPIQTLDDLEGAFASGLREKVSAFYISGELLLASNRLRVMPFVAASGKPTVSVYPEWVRAGLLMSYSSDRLDGFRQAGTYVAKILSGTRPGDLPIVQAAKFDLAINLKTAKALGLTVPNSLLVQATEVIE